MNADQLAGVERAFLGSLLIVATVILAVVYRGDPSLPMILSALIGLDGAAVGYWFGQASK